MEGVASQPCGALYHVGLVSELRFDVFDARTGWLE